MKKYRTRSRWRMFGGVLSVLMIVSGLCLLAYPLFIGGTPATALKVIAEGLNPAAEPPEETTLRLTVPDMKRVEDMPVYYSDSTDEEALAKGTLHVEGTGFPWQDVANVYIAGHRLGYPATRSNLVFWDLDKLENGDEVILTDANGTQYTYEVFKQFVVNPGDVSVLQPLPGRNIVTLQTCTLPDYSQRLLVQAELKSVS